MIENYLERKLTKKEKEEITNIVSQKNPKVNTFTKAKNLLCKNYNFDYDTQTSSFSIKKHDFVETAKISTEEDLSYKIERIFSELKELRKENTLLKERIELLENKRHFDIQDFLSFRENNEPEIDIDLQAEQNYINSLNKIQDEDEEIPDEQIFSFSNLKIEEVFGEVLLEKPKRINYSSQHEYETFLKMWEYQEIFRREQLEEEEEENEEDNLFEEEPTNLIKELNKDAMSNSFRNEVGLAMLNDLEVKKYNEEEILIIPITFKKHFEYYNNSRCPFNKDKKGLTDYGKKQIITTFINFQGYELVEINPKTQTMKFIRK